MGIHFFYLIFLLLLFPFVSFNNQMISFVPPVVSHKNLKEIKYLPFIRNFWHSFFHSSSICRKFFHFFGTLVAEECWWSVGKCNEFVLNEMNSFHSLLIDAWCRIMNIWSVPIEAFLIILIQFRLFSSHCSGINFTVVMIFEWIATSHEPPIYFYIYI